MLMISILDIPTIHNPPISLTDIIYNCPVCDYEIEIDMIVNEDSSLNCDNCNHKIVLKIRKV